MPSSTPDVFLGLISGTSADGIDAALVRFQEGGEGGSRLRAELLFGRTYPWEPALRARLVELGQEHASLGLDDFGELDTRIASAFADAALQALADSGVPAAQVAAVGSHGQTLRHRPHGRHHDGRHRFTLQLGDPGLIAERTGITTVADFRRRDVAAGGQGAPLLPALHAALLQSPDEPRAVLNLGGIANLTLLPARGTHDTVRGFDTGPANGLLDAWCLRHTGQPYDRGGAFAARGRVDSGLLMRLRDEPWFALAPPKSSGRDQFHLGWVEARLTGTESPADVQATLLALTATTVADALHATQADTARVIACGGGVHNPVLMQALAAALSCPLESSAVRGLDPDFVEAMGFAWLARQTLRGLPGNLSSVTGATGPRILGGIYPAG